MAKNKTSLMMLLDWLELNSNAKQFKEWEELKTVSLELEKKQIIEAYEAALEVPFTDYGEAYYNMNYLKTNNYGTTNI